MAGIAWEIGGRNAIRVMDDGSVVAFDRWPDMPERGLSEDEYDDAEAYEESMLHRQASWGVESGKPYNVFARIEGVAFDGFDEETGMRKPGSPERLAMRWEFAQTYYRLDELARSCGLTQTSEAIHDLLDRIGQEDRELADMAAGYSHLDRLFAKQDDLAWLREHPVGTVIAHEFAEGRPGDSHFVTIITDHGDRLVMFYEGVDEYGMPLEVRLDVKMKSS